MDKLITLLTGCLTLLDEVLKIYPHEKLWIIKEILQDCRFEIETNQDLT